MNILGKYHIMQLTIKFSQANKLILNQYIFSIYLVRSILT